MKEETAFGTQAYRDENIVALMPGSDKKIYQTGLKVLKNLSDKCFLAAYTVSLNGQTLLVYDVNGLEPMSTLLPQIGPDAFLKILESLVDANHQIRENGFIKSDNILMDRDNIFISTATMQVRLLYLPLQEELENTAQLNSLELRVHSLILEILELYPNLMDSRTARLRSFLSSPSNRLEQFFDYLTQEKQRLKAPIKKEPSKRLHSSNLYLHRIGGNTRFVLRIHHRGTTIGRDINKADCVIQDGSVSGIHCKVYRNESGWMVEDQGSTNGTKLNDRQLSAFQPVPIKQGDVLKLSRFIFRVSEEE